MAEDTDNTTYVTEDTTTYEDYPDNPYYTAHMDQLKQQNIFRSLNTYLSIISIVGGLIVLTIIIAMWLYDKKLVNRVSLRLTAVISFVDAVTGAVVITYAWYEPKDTSLCTFIGWGMSFFPQLYLFLTAMIAFNLQVILKLLIKLFVCL